MRLFIGNSGLVPLPEESSLCFTCLSGLWFLSMAFLVAQTDLNFLTMQEISVPPGLEEGNPGGGNDNQYSACRINE